MTEPTRDRRIEDATRLLCHYFRLAIQSVGGKWDSDNEAEMRGLAEMLVGRDHDG